MWKRIYVDPVIQKTSEFQNDEIKEFSAGLAELVEFTKTDEFRRENQRAIEKASLDPNDNETYVVESIRPLLQGDMEGAMNGEYWNETNCSDPLEMHPKCIGDVSMLKGFKDEPKWWLLDTIESALLERIYSIY